MNKTKVKEHGKPNSYWGRVDNSWWTFMSAFTHAQLKVFLYIRTSTGGMNTFKTITESEIADAVGLSERVVSNALRLFEMNGFGFWQRQMKRKDSGHYAGYEYRWNDDDDWNMESIALFVAEKQQQRDVWILDRTDRFTSSKNDRPPVIA